MHFPKCLACTGLVISCIVSRDPCLTRCLCLRGIYSQFLYLTESSAFSCILLLSANNWAKVPSVYACILVLSKEKIVVPGASCSRLSFSVLSEDLSSNIGQMSPLPTVALMIHRLHVPLYSLNKECTCGCACTQAHTCKPLLFVPSDNVMLSDFLMEMNRWELFHI